MQILPPNPPRRRIRLFRNSVVLAALLPAMVLAQAPAEYQQILERLDRLEKQNHELLEQVTALRHELAARTAPEAEAPAIAQVQERAAIQEQQIQTQQQTKVEASQHFPIRITGMALFNAYLNSSFNNNSEYATVASTTPGSERGNATMRQTVIGLDYRGPETIWGGKVHGSLYMDFFGGSGQSLDQDVHIRTGSIEVDWKSRSVMAGLEKPIFAPREPNSLAQVGISPLTGTGNLWLWVPQVKFEQRFKFGDQTQVRAQVGMIATHETLALQATSYSPQVASSARPGLEGRFEFSHGAEGGRRIEIAPGFRRRHLRALQPGVARLVL